MFQLIGMSSVPLPLSERVSGHSLAVPKLIFVAFLVAVVLFGCGGPAERKAQHLAKGKAYLEQENFEKARIELKNVLQIDPKESEAYFLIGSLEEQNQEWRKAYAYYQKAVEIDPQHWLAKAKLGRLMLFFGNVEGATQLTEEILAEHPGHAEGRFLKAAILASKEDLRGAVDELQEVIADYPKLVDAVSYLASLHARLGESNKAVEILRNGAKAVPDSIAIKKQLAMTYAARMELSEAEQQIREMIALEPEEFGHRVMLASFFDRAKQPEKAEQALREAVASSPEDAQRYLLLSDFLLKTKGSDAAETLLRAAQQERPEASAIKFGLAKLYEQSGKRDQAIDLYKSLIEREGLHVDGQTARVQLAVLYLGQGRGDEASVLLEEVLQENPRHNQALLIKGRIALSKRDATTAVNAFRSLEKDQPNSVELAILLANAHMLNGASELAKEVLERAAKNNPRDIPVRLRLAQLLANLGQTELALARAEEAVAVEPDNLRAWEAKVELIAASKDVGALHKILAEVQERFPASTYGFSRMGQAFLDQREFQAAVKQFEKAVSIAPLEFEPLAGLLKAHMAQNRHDQAIAVVRRILKENPAHPSAHNLLGEVHMAQKQYGEAEQAFRKAIDVNPDWEVPYGNLANVYLVRGDTERAITMFKQGLSANPDSPLLAISLAGALERAKAYDEALASYDAVVARHPDNLMALNNLALLLADRKGDRESLARADRLTVSFEKSSNAALLDTRAWVLLKRGNLRKALPMLEAIVKQVPGIPDFEYHLGVAYFQKGDREAAREHLAAAVKAGSDFVGATEARKLLEQIAQTP